MEDQSCIQALLSLYGCFDWCDAVKVKADVYEKIDKELLEFVEDVLLNRCENATERMLEYAGSLDPKSKPTAVRKKGQVISMKTNQSSILLF